MTARGTNMMAQKRLDAWTFGILLLCHVIYVFVTMIAAPKKNYIDVELLVWALTTLVFLGLGTWVWLGLRVGRYRVGALCFAAFCLVGVMVSAAVAMSDLDKLGCRIILGYDALYLLWILITMGFVLAAYSRRE